MLNAFFVEDKKVCGDKLPLLDNAFVSFTERKLSVTVIDEAFNRQFTNTARKPERVKQKLISPTNKETIFVNVKWEDDQVNIPIGDGDMIILTEAEAGKVRIS